MYSFLILAGAIASSGAFIDYLKNLPSSNCTDNDFICANNLQCIPMAKRCDKTIDCSDFSDEEDCETVNCEEPNFFRCKNNRCVSSVFVCDGENDCEDFSDEQKCENFQNNFQTNSTCKEKQWQCTDRLCIPEEWVCNGESDCLDGSDEILGCSSNIECDGFKCKNGHCIAKEWRCDGQDDCRDNSDEIDCKNMVDPKDCTFDNQRFLCADGKTCIKLSEVCNEIPQCPDKSDESASCKISCNNYTCSHDCISLPTGPKCICPKGYHTIDEKHCQDINECETYGICDQKCKNLPGSYECLCDESYSLKEDKKNCKAHFGEAIMFFSSKKEIRAYLMKSEIYFPVAKNLRQVVGVDYDGRYVYWTDIFSEHESIVRSLKNGTERELIVTSGLGAPEDIHIDHITNNIYFTDAERQHIGVCTKDGTHCTVLVNKDVQKPRGIVLYPEQGEMYWTDWGHTPEIARAFMDGSDDMSFVSNDIHWPNGLTIDYPNERLYWTDAKLATLESIRLDGTGRRVVLEGVVKHPYAIAVFENRLYWSDWATHSIQSCDKFTGKNHHTLIKENKDFIYGISIYHPNLRKKPMINPCVLSFCSDICLLHGPSTYTCACPQDKELSIDRHTCKDLGKKQKLILGAHNMLIRVEHQLLGKHEITALPVLIKKIGALAYNSVNHSLYISDLEIRKIISLDLHSGTSMPLAIWDLGQVVAMDYDYLGNNLYWCDAERKTIEVVNLNTMSRKILLHDMHEESPESIALVPEEGVMFVALKKYNRRETHIDRIFMDGTSRTHPVEHGILGPINLYYDNDLHRVFISDAGTGNIETTSVEGDDRHGFRSLQTSPIGITTLKNDLFWVNENSRRLYWANKYNTDDHDHNKKITLDLPDDIDRMYITSITPKRIGLSPCQNRNGGCSHLCLHSQKSIICACPIGMSLDEDNHTCIKRIECISDEFFCGKSNHCISNKFRCDGVKNCQNGEDEDDCKVANHCPLDSFQCEDGECVKETARCDQHYDCRDKSDEHNCSRREARTCPPKHFKCHDGKCINERLVCDALKDCEDGEDEDNCLSTVCKDGEFRCLSGACIPKSWECDHEYDCPDFSDEHAHCATCSPNMFTCANSKCIDKGFVCDNENDCGDNSDETSCDKQEETCNQGEFSCASHQHVCLPIVARCNGTSECPHHEDEQNCSNCGVEEFTCNNKKCIATQWVCDHSDDCGDGSDEASSLCSHDSASSAKSHLPCHDLFQCSNGNCIDYSLVCNREPNCYDGSDEEGVCNTSCNSMNNPCGQICQKTPTGPMCKCEQGYRLQGDAQNCEDIDECKNQPPVCSQLCHNLPGTYICDCYEGFLLKSDKMSCKAEGTAMAMIFTSDNQIRELSQMENSLKLIYLEDTPKITGLDVDIKNSTIYFSIESSGTIHRINKKSSQLEYMQIGQPQKLSLDWITNNIYFVNNEPNSKAISICNFDSKTCANLIPIDIHRQVSAITIDAVNKFIFYSVASWWMFNSPNYVIYKANLDGTGRHELIKSTSGYITGLTFDLNKKELFYVDQHKGQLGKITYDGLFNSVLQSNLTRPVGLNFYENHLFFLTSGGYMEKCRLYIPSNCDSFKLNTYSNELFAIVQESRQPEVQDSCKNHTCSHLCIPTKLHYKCLCEDGKLITADEECANKERTMVSNGGKRLLAIHQYQPDSDSSPNLGPMIAGIIISFCLLILSVVFYYIVRKRNSGSFNISMRFHNPAYGLHTDEAEKSILQPGQHEYSNPVDFYETETESNKKTALLVDV